VSKIKKGGSSLYSDSDSSYISNSDVSSDVSSDLSSDLSSF
jgi:hypothetical protein